LNNSVHSNHKSTVLSVRLFLFALSVCLLITGGHLYTPDGEVLFRSARSYSQFQAGAIEPLGGMQTHVDKQGREERKLETGFASRAGLDGRQYAQYEPGQPVLAVPFVWAGEIFSRILPEEAQGALDIRSIQYHSRSLEDYAVRFIVSLFNAFVTAGLVVIVFRFSKHLFSENKAATWAALSFLLGTVALPHSKTFLREPLAALCALGSFLLVVEAFSKGISARKQKLLLTLSGLAFGYALLTRMDSLMFAPGLGLYLLIRLWPRLKSDWKERLANLLMWAAPVIVCGLVILGLNTIRYGSPFSTGYSDQPEGIVFNPPWLGLYGYLLLPGRAFFIYSPVLLAGLYGFYLLWKSRRPEFIGLTLTMGVFLFFQASWQNWAGGWDWGPRHIYQLAPFVAVGLGGFFSGSPVMQTPWKRTLWIVVLIAAAVINFLGVAASPMDAYGTLPARFHPLVLSSPSFSPPALHWNLLTEGRWDLALPRLLGSSSLVLKIGGLLFLAFFGFSCWWLYQGIRPSPPQDIGGC
jgi:hypothetical protein